MNQVETGDLLGEFPFARVGDGPGTIVVVPGIDDAMFDGWYPRPLAWGLYWYFSRFVGEYSVHVVSRPRGLPEGHTIEDMADDYARAMESELGPAVVVGISMGGMIGQALAVRHPELVDRLVVANSGCRFGDAPALDRIRDDAERRDWGAIRAELGAAMFSDVRRVTYPLLAATVGRFVAPTPADPADVSVSLSAVGLFDGCHRLDRIEAPALVFGGSEDPYFPPSLLRETAAGMTDSERVVVPGARHGAFHERKATFDDRVAAFLERPAVPARRPRHSAGSSP